MRRSTILLLGVIYLVIAGCRPSDVLSVPAPTGVQAGGSLLGGQAGTESIFNGAKGQLFVAADASLFTGDGLLMWSELLTDEFTYAAFSFFGNDASTDARLTAGGGGFVETADTPWGELLQARSALTVVLPKLIQYETGSGLSKVGEASALMGYAELLLAEDFCAGTPLDQVLPAGSVQYGTPLTTDSLLAVAESDFDSALVHANGDPNVQGLASVGLGRALVGRGQYAAAATAVAAVPTAFVYNVTLQPDVNTAPHVSNTYATFFTSGGASFFNVGDSKGGNGLGFISAHDPRLMFDTTLQTLDQAVGAASGVWYVPLKFENDLADIPLATGIEARLIEAEAALQRGDPAWAGDLNALRADSGDTHVPFPDSVVTIPADSTTGASATAQVDVLFRERAFWLYGTGTRLGDLRRLIRQYGRDQSTVYPTGPYPNGANPGLPQMIPNYGSDVSLTLPTPAGLATNPGGLVGNGETVSNPHYKGCLTSTKTG